MDRFGDLISRRRWLFLILMLGLSLGAAKLLPQLNLSFSLMPILQADEETQARVDEFQTSVPPNFYDQIFVLEFPRAMEKQELQTVSSLSTALEADVRVSSVTSLGNVTVVSNFGLIPLPQEFQLTLRDGETVLDAARRHPLLERRLISADGRSATFLVKSSHDDGDKHAALLVWLEEYVDAFVTSDVRAHFIGDEVSKRAMRKYMGADLKQGLLLELLVFSILLPLIFRTFRGILIPLTVVVMAQMFCFAALVIAGLDFGLIDMAVPGIITMITVCDAVHMMHRFEESLLSGKNRHGAILEMMASIGPACFFTSLTTAIGFLSLVVAKHPAVRLFGIKASIAVLIAFLAIITVVPLMLSFWPVKKGVLARVPGFTKLTYGKRKLTFAVFGAVLVFALIGISRLNVDSHWLEEMPDREPLIQDLAWYEDNFSGIMTFDVRIKGDLAQAQNFEALEKFQERMLKESGVNKSECYTHWLREVSGDQEKMSQARIDRGFKFLSLKPDVFPGHIINPNLQDGRITFLTDDSGTSRFFELRELVRKLNQEMPHGLNVEVAGFMEMAHEASRLIVTTMLESFLVSLLAISILISFIFRSVRVGLVSIVPNVFPILIALGMNGWLDINLRIGIVMIYSLGLGLAVDDTIHLITRYRQERKKHPHGERRPQIMRALKGAGPALITTSIVLAIGSLSYLPSSFRSLRDVGLLLTAIVITALLADLFLLPHLLELAEAKNSKGGKE